MDMENEASGDFYEKDDLLLLFATGFSKYVTDDQLYSHFCQFGVPSEITVVEEYQSMEDKEFVFVEDG